MADELANVAAHSTDRALIVRVSGQLSGVHADDEAVRDAVSPAGSGDTVVFDLCDVHLLTAGGVRLLGEVVDALHARAVRCRLVVDRGSPVATVLRGAGLPPALRTFADVDEATAAGDGPGEPATGLEPDELAERFAALTRALVAETTVGGVLRRVVAAALVVVPGADLVGVTVRDPTGAFHTPVHTGPVAESLDDVQHRAREGPCVDAARPDGPAYAASDDLTTEGRWPRFAEAATGHGVAAVLSTDLLPAAGPVVQGGALNIYSQRVRGLRADDRHAALLLATHAALALAYAKTQEAADLRARQLLRAIETRDVIGQAKGILMARQGMTDEEAFDLLRRTSQDLNVKLVDLARTLAAHPDRLGTA